MRQRISWLVAATTSAVVLAFVIPLCLLARTLAEDRALADGDDEAQAVALLVAGVSDRAQLRQLVENTDNRSPVRTSVLLPDGTVLGSPAPGLDGSDADVARALSGTAFRTVTSQGGRIFVPVAQGQDTVVVVTEVGSDLMRAGVTRAWASIAALGVVLLALALFVADRIGRRVSEPVTDLATVAQRLQDGDLDARAEPRGPEETVELAETVNRLADRIVELLAAERAAVGDLSHRLRTPVTALRLDAEAVDDQEVAARLQSHVEHLQRTIDALVRDARRPLRTGLTAACDATAVVASRVAFWSALAEDQGRRLDLDLPGHPVPVGLEASDLVDLLDVLVDNVFAHTPDDVGFAVRLHRSGDVAVLEVADRGPGLGQGVREDDDRPGTTGLGLQIVRRTAARVGGHVDLTDAGPGLVAAVTLPVLRSHDHGRSTGAARRG